MGQSVVSTHPFSYCWEWYCKGGSLPCSAYDGKKYMNPSCESEADGSIASEPSLATTGTSRKSPKLKGVFLRLVQKRAALGMERTIFHQKKCSRFRLGGEAPRLGCTFVMRCNVVWSAVVLSIMLFP